MRISIDLNNYKSMINLKAGENCFLNGTIYTARDAAHKLIMEMIEKGEKLPFDIKDFNVYYAGPTPARDGEIVGSCGPTTSTRMDNFSPKLIALGQRVMIGKGERSEEVINACKQYKAVYFCATGGAGALLSLSVKSSEVIAFPELGCESVKKMTIENFPVVVGIDSNGYSIFKNRYLEVVKNGK